MSSPVLYEVEAHVATITLNRPAVLNALNEEMLDELSGALQWARDDNTVRAVLLKGAGDGFCAGADLKTSFPPEDLAAHKVDIGGLLRERYNPVILGIRELPKPVIAAVNGPAAGAGMSLALACDIILAGRSASFVQAFSKLGLIPDAGSTWSLPRLVGHQAARAMMLLAERISAEDAYRLGMVWKVLDDKDLQADALTLARTLALGPTRGYGLIKQALALADGSSLAVQLENEAQIQSEAGQTFDCHEGVAAFLAKRPAVFKGE